MTCFSSSAMGRNRGGDRGARRASIVHLDPIRERQYRLTIYQQTIDGLRALIDQRAAAYKDISPGGASGLLVRRVHVAHFVTLGRVGSQSRHRRIFPRSVSETFALINRPQMQAVRPADHRVESRRSALTAGAKPRIRGPGVQECNSAHPSGPCIAGRFRLAAGTAQGLLS
jgi:hypothetical protein